MLHQITVMPHKRNIEATPGENLQNALLRAGFYVNAPCGGNGSCGKCKVLVNGEEVSSCRTRIDRDMVVMLPALESSPEFRHYFEQNTQFYNKQTPWLQIAIDLGFSKAVPIDVSTLQPRQDVRDMCAADKCRAYGKNWTCPPNCGTLDECGDRIRSYSHGILLQTTGITKKTIDTKAYRRTETQHLEQFHAFCERIRKSYPNALCLGSGGCRICSQCAYPEKCCFPDKAYSSMEGYGLFVTQVCRDNGCDYHYGEKTITYTACVLY